MKALFWDRDGFIIFYKRLEKGVFVLHGQKSSLDRREFWMLFDGVIPKKLRAKFL